MNRIFLSVALFSVIAVSAVSVHTRTPGACTPSEPMRQNWGFS